MSRKLPWLCPHCGEGKRYPLALCGSCMRFSNQGHPARDSRLMREASGREARPDPQDESGGGAANRTTNRTLPTQEGE